MPAIKEFNVKLKSLRSTQKITKTMKMVSASKLRRAHEAQVNARLYARNLAALTSRISAAVSQESHPLLTPRQKIRNVAILIITSDKGLCGAFNHNANRMVSSWIDENRHRHEDIDLWCCGKKGFMYFARHDIVKRHYESVTGNPQFLDAQRIGDDLAGAFCANLYDEVYLSYNQFFNPICQKTVFERILPIEARALTQEKVQAMEEYLFEPPAKQLLRFLIPHFLYFKIYFALLENAAGEHGARMTAMDSATRNTEDMIDRYTLFRNRARQAAITTELAEIVAGAEALK